MCRASRSKFSSCCICMFLPVRAADASRICASEVLWEYRKGDKFRSMYTSECSDLLTYPLVVELSMAFFEELLWNHVFIFDPTG